MLTPNRLTQRYASWIAVILIFTSQPVHSEEDILQTGLRDRLKKMQRRVDQRMSNADDHTAASPQPQGNEEPNKAGPANMADYDPTKYQEFSDPLMKKVEQAIDITTTRPVYANLHSPWQLFHGVLALRNGYTVRLGRQEVNVIEWLSTSNPQFAGKPLFYKTQYGGRTHKFTEPFHFEGHPNQFPALLTMSNLPADHTFSIGRGQTITMMDLVNQAKMEANTREEMTWTLWFLAQYLHPDDEWINQTGDHWSMERLVRIQTDARVIGTACGGTHGLFALAFARKHYLEKTNRPLRGVWLEADQKVKRHILMARSLQRTDGSFPTGYFSGTGTPTDLKQRLAAPGHMMEWLSMALPDDQLDDAWVRRGINYVADTLIRYRYQQADCGPMYHALNALISYRDRIRALNEKNSNSKPRKIDMANAKPISLTTPKPETTEPETTEPETTAEEANNAIGAESPSEKPTPEKSVKVPEPQVLLSPKPAQPLLLPAPVKRIEKVEESKGWKAARSHRTAVEDVDADDEFLSPIVVE